MPSYSSTNGRPTIGQLSNQSFSLTFPQGPMPSLGTPSLSQLTAQRQAVWNEQQRLTDRMVEVLAVLTASAPPHDAAIDDDQDSHDSHDSQESQESWSCRMAPLWTERQQLRRQLESIEMRERELTTRISMELTKQIAQAQNLSAF